jgi:hypothetical protein
MANTFTICTRTSYSRSFAYYVISLARDRNARLEICALTRGWGLLSCLVWGGAWNCPPPPLPRKWRESGATNAAPCVQSFKPHTSCRLLFCMYSHFATCVPWWSFVSSLEAWTISSVKSVKLKEVVKPDRPVMVSIGVRVGGQTTLYYRWQLSSER